MKFLAIDLGEKRTGLAVGDDTTRIASPLMTIHASRVEDRLSQIDRAIREHRTDAIVVGLPVNMDGTEGEAARKAREFGDCLASRFGLPVHMVDERLSTETADAQLRDRGLTRKGKRARRDALAAAAILNTFLTSL